MQKNDNIESLAHTKWRCQYHIVFAPKYRRQAIYGKYKAEIGKILRELCKRNGIEIIEANACADHIHMLVSIPPKMSVSKFMGILKGKSSLMIFESSPIYIWESTLLGERILRRYSWTKQKCNSKIHTKSDIRE